MARLHGGRWKVGDIRIWTRPLADIPKNWQLCDGTNGTPDLVDNAPVGAGNLFAQNEKFGQDRYRPSASIGVTTLSQSQMPSHTHTRNFNVASGNGGTKPVGFTNVGSAFTKNTGSTGGSDAHGHSITMGTVTVYQPSIAVYFIMKIK
ncbi:hypothetical protein [Vibrio viridaestus]|uniref:Tail fiber protein n=1 Tax=Vibrio viridaestus TaxID=2487322 RepID=A0A3N9TBA4_9VIBR|nr:hypothetical protein [Vibrio viridaestus]RQW61034.1 hypothetical protein EES38_21535 [Vibrio viridaestus]